jgi:hypothetical protein
MAATSVNGIGCFRAESIAYNDGIMLGVVFHHRHRITEPHIDRRSRSRNPAGTGPESGPAELRFKLRLRTGERSLPFCRKMPAGPIDVEGEHRQGGSIRIGFSPLARLGGTLQRSGNPLGIIEREDSLLKVECITCSRHALRPAARTPPWRSLRVRAAFAEFPARSRSRRPSCWRSSHVNLLPTRR